MAARISTALAFSLFLTGCSSLGPKTIERDRLDYGSALSETLKRQTVLNIVKSRYLDWPAFLDVGQVVAGYSRQGNAGAGFTWFPDASAANNLGVNVGGAYSENPTITYSPLVGANFAQMLLQPILPQSLIAVAYTGWKVDRLLDLTLNGINGKRNAQFVGDRLEPADPGFVRALELFETLQAAGGWRVNRSVGAGEGSTEQAITISFRDGAAEIQRQIDELREVLDLDPSVDTYRVAYGDQAEDRRTIALESRTLWEIFWELQRFVEVPAEHAGRVIPLPEETLPPILSIRSGSAPPATAFVAVPYRGTWYWIDDHDLESKHTLSAILLMFTLARPGGEEPPQLVIPTR